MNVQAVVAIAALAVTVLVFLGQIIFHMGRLTARVEALEKWRESMRADLHEISDKIEAMVTELQTVHTLIEERTDRRQLPRS